MAWLGVKPFNYQFIPHRPLQILFLFETIFQNHIQFVFIVAHIVYELEIHLHVEICLLDSVIVVLWSTSKYKKKS